MGLGAASPETLGTLTETMATLHDLPGQLADRIVAGLLAHVGELAIQVIIALAQALGNGLDSVVHTFLDDSLDVVTHTSPSMSYANPTVRELWDTTRKIANAALAIIALGGGFNLILRPHFGTPYHTAVQFLPRFIVGALLVNTSLWWGRWAIDVNNALCSAFYPLPLPDLLRMLAPHHFPSDSLVPYMMGTVANLLYLVAWCLLYVQMLMRLAVVDLLLVVSPLALLLWVLPQTEGWSRLWSSTFASSVFTQFLQVLTLKLGRSLIADSTLFPLHNFAASTLVGIAVIVVTFRVPRLLRFHLGGGLDAVRSYAVRLTTTALTSTPAGHAAGRSRGRPRRPGG